MTVDQLRRDYQRFARRTSRLLILLVALQFATGAASVYLIGQNSDRVDQIQAERVKNTRASCERANAQNSAILGFITASIPAGKRSDPQVLTYLARASRTFPQQDCAAVVRRQVKP